MEDEKKKNVPDEETEEQKKEQTQTSAEETSGTQSETSEKAAEKQGTESAEEKAKEKEDDPKAEQKEDSSTAQAGSDNPEKADFSQELLFAKAELAAIKSGMDVSFAEDAVVLAVHDIRKEGGTPDSDSIEKAVKNVLKRHPEWNAKKETDKSAGFKVGADGTKNQAAEDDDAISRAFGNK